MTTLTSDRLLLRPAVQADAPFIALCVYWALGEDFSICSEQEKNTKLTRMTAVCGQSDTLYSWCNTLIAEVGGEPAGALVYYDGARYAALRKNTFERLGDLVSEAARTMEDETCAGEYYFDSLAVAPAYQRLGIARRLLLQGLETVRRQGFRQAALVVVPDSMAMRFYQSLGFVPAGRMFLFGEDYQRMTFAL